MKTKLLLVASFFISSTAFGQCTLDAWDYENTGSNPVVANTNNPLSGSCSLEVPVTTGKRYVQDNMDQEGSFRGTFQIDPNSIDIPTSGSGRKIKVHNVQCSSGCGSATTVDWLQSKIRKQASGYKIGTWVAESDGNKVSVSLDLVDGCNVVEYQLIAGNPGTFRMWVNNSSENAPDFESTSLDFTDRYTDRVRLGRMGQGANINANATGENFYLDSFESRRQTFIGNTCQ